MHCEGYCLIINIRLVASCWFLSLHPTFMMHGHKNLKKRTYINFFTLKHLKLRQHVSIFLDHPQGATLFLAKITFLKYTH